MALVDLRSDTVTQPTADMRRAMADAVVGDDDYGEDPTVRALEEAFAERLGKPASLFVPSGTMANQIALRVLATAGTAVVAGRRQHLVAYEYGAAARNSAVQFHAVDDADGMLRPADVALGTRGVGVPSARGVAGQYREHPHGGGRGPLDDGAPATPLSRPRAMCPSTSTGPASSMPRPRPGWPHRRGRRR